MLCYVAMDDDLFLSDADSRYGESEDDFAIKSKEENNSDSMNVGKVLSSLDFVLFVHLCNIIIWYMLLPFLDQNPADDGIDTAEMLKTFKHVQEALSRVCSKICMVKIHVFKL